MQKIQRRLLPSTSALAAFDAVARLASFSAAALELSLTQGAISRQIAGLEAQLGVRLFERSTRATLTPTGQIYARSIASALEIIRSASLEAMTRMHGNTLNLAILPTFGTRWLMPRISGFIARHPGIILNFATRIGQFDFESEALDAAIHVGARPWPGTESRFLMSETVLPVCSPDFLNIHPIESPNDLRDLPLLHMASRPGAWDHWFASLDLPPPAGRGMGFEQFSNVEQACMAGLGIGLMPAFLIRSELASGQLVRAWPHEIESNSTYSLVYPISRRSHPPLVAFADWLEEEAQAFSRTEP
jgi:DNA-binding transcriptional LysR family regulator